MQLAFSILWSMTPQESTAGAFPMKLDLSPAQNSRKGLVGVYPWHHGWLWHVILSGGLEYSPPVLICRYLQGFPPLVNAEANHEGKLGMNHINLLNLKSHKQKIALKIYWAWPSPSEQDPVTLSVSLSHQEASESLLSSSIRGQTDWKLQSQKTNQSD